VKTEDVYPEPRGEGRERQGRIVKGDKGRSLKSGTVTVKKRRVDLKRPEKEPREGGGVCMYTVSKKI